jgi:hypothetical protein
VEHGDAAGVGDDAVADLGQPEPRALGGDADVALTQPLQATSTAASRSQSCWMPRMPRRISSACDSPADAPPMAATSRPDDHDVPSPRQMTARTSGRCCSSARKPHSAASISSSQALCLSGLRFVIVATAPSISSVIRSLTRR